MIGLVLLIIKIALAVNLTNSAEVNLRVGYNTTSFAGITCPYCLVYFRARGVTHGTTLSNGAGEFEKTLEYLPNGFTEMGLFSVDIHSWKSASLLNSFTLVDDSVLSLGNIILPPTVFFQDYALQGRYYDLNGTSIPGSIVYIDYIGTGKLEQATAGTDGYWKSNIETNTLKLGNYGFRLKTKIGNNTTEWGPRYDFRLEVDPNPPTPTPSLTPTPTPTPLPTPIPTPTLAPEFGEILKNLKRVPELLRYVNKDGLLSITNTTEVTKIWMLAWNEVLASERQGQRASEKNLLICDLNFDQVCDIRDFSILMYYSR